MEIPLVIGPFVEFRRPDNRPEQKTTHEAQQEDCHVVRCLQYLNDADFPKYSRGPINGRAPSMVGHRSKPKTKLGIGVELDWMLGWEEHAPNRGRLGTAEILGGL